MKFAKNIFIKFKGSHSSIALNDELLPAAHVKDLGVDICPELSWNCHASDKIKKANKIPYFIRRNTAANTKTSSKLNLFKTMIMPMLSYASAFITLSRSTSRSLDNLQKRVLRWAFNDKSAIYHFFLEKGNILPIHMYFQLLNLLLLSSMFYDS